MKIRTSLPIVFTVPTMVVLAILAFVPTIDAINIALQNRELSNPDSVYVGFANFRALVDDPRFLNSVWVSIEWEILTVVATMAVAIPLAVLMSDATSPNVRNALSCSSCRRSCRASRRLLSGASPFIRCLVWRSTR